MTQVVTLVEAALGILDGELWGGIAVRPKSEQAQSSTKLYAQYIPQHPYTDPPGWAAIAEITGVSAEEVVASWSDDDRYNPAAERAFAMLQQEAGQEFLVRELNGVEGKQAIELILLKVDDPSIHIDLDEGRTDAGEPIRFAQITDVALNVDINDTVPPTMAILLDGAPACQIELPDVDHNPDPPAYWTAELITEIPAVKLAYSWSAPGAGKQSGMAINVVNRMRARCYGKQAPLTSDGTLDIAAFRRAYIRERFWAGEDPKLYCGRNPKVTCQRAWDLLKATVGGHLFRYNVTRGVSSGLPSLIRDVEGQSKLEVLDIDEKVTGALFHHIDFVSATKGTAPRHIRPPSVVVKNMLTFADQSVPAIDTLVRIPTMRRDGTIHDREGYDRKSRIWYAPEISVDAVPDVPTDSDMRQALATILTPLADFPFVDGAGSRAGAVALMLDQIVRPMIPGPRPLYIIDAPAFRGQGTGKTLLAKAIASVVIGRTPEVTGWPEDPKELPKLIVSKLMQSDPITIFDNLEGVIHHRDLSALATSEVWSSRVLHTNNAPHFPQTATWVLTLNGARYNTDIARRSITIKLDTGSESPSDRVGFTIEDLIPWCIQHRASIIRACLTLARAWVCAGRPRDKRLRLGSFEAWARVVGGILLHAGISDLPLAIEESRARDVDATEHEEFINRWRETYGGTKLTALQLATLAETYHLFGNVLEGKAPNWKGRYMADILKALKKHSFSGWKVHKDETRSGGHFMYRLVPPDGEKNPSNGSNPSLTL
jgi:hypothetical protein